VTTADEAQSISVIDTFPQLAEADVAPSDSANAAVAVNILSFICVSLLSFFLHRRFSDLVTHAAALAAESWDLASSAA
jgi:hypothetical protein